MKVVYPELAIAAAALCLYSAVQAAEQFGSANCAKPNLNMDFQNQAQIRMLEHDFGAYEACVVDYVSAVHAKVRALEKAVVDLTNEEPLADEYDGDTVEFLDEMVETMEGYKESVDHAKRDLEIVVQAILERVPARIFNQWDAETKVVEN